MTKWGIARLLTYAAGFVASGLALAGLADFDAGTGYFDLAPFNLYTAIGAVAGLLSSGLAGLALWRGWGAKK